MIELIFEPFSYQYMRDAILVSMLVGGVCAFMSAYLVLKGWSLMGDALAHSIVPGVALAYLLALPYAIGAFFAGLLAAGSMAFVRQQTKLREDVIIGMVFTTFFAIGLLMVSINPTSVNIQGIILGNILAISRADIIQVVIISLICLACLLVTWKNLVSVFFDETHARSIGLPVTALNIMFFTLLSGVTVAALQTVGACLVIAMVVTPGATAYLLTDRFGKMICLSIVLGVLTSGIGAYASYYLNTPPGGLIVTLQTIIFLIAFIAAPKYGYLTTHLKIRQAGKAQGGA